MIFDRRARATLLGAVVAFAFSLFLSYPLLPVLVAIAMAARIGKSKDWRAGMLYGAVIGPAGFFLRIYGQSDPPLAPYELILAFLSAAAIFGVAGIGIARLLCGEDSIMF